MPASAALIVDWARSAVVPHGGAFADLTPHEMAAPVVQALLARCGVPPDAVDAVVVGNALGAGGNPARMVGLAAGLPERCPALSVDSQCCAGLDAVALGVALLAAGQAQVVLAGGVEAWSRAPIRAHRPQHAGQSPQPYERPAFAPDPARDPDMLVSAQAYATQGLWSRAQQDAYALHSHERALARRQDLAREIVAVHGVAHDPYPRHVHGRHAARLQPLVAFDPAAPPVVDCAMTALHVSAKADGAAFVLLATEQACRRWGLRPPVQWVAGASVGVPPPTPLLGAALAASQLIGRLSPAQAAALAVIELHDAFAVQGLDFAQQLELAPERINRCGGGLVRGHPIGASGAVALVRMLTDLCREADPGALGLAAIAGAGGLGAAALVQRAPRPADLG